MEIKQYSQLDSHLLKQIEQLEAIVHAHDKTERDIYLDNRFNFNQTMPYVLLAWDKDEVVACLHIYADNQEDVEISIIVHPAFRRQGIASKMKKAALKIVADYDIEDVTFVSEKVFLDQSDYWKKNFYWTQADVEYLMLAEAFETENNLPQSPINIRLATKEDVPAIAKIQAQAFDSPLEESITYAEGALADDFHLIYIFGNSDQQIVGSTSVNIASDYYYFFGLAVAVNFHGQGIATSAIQQVMSVLASKNPLPYRLAVDADNPAAIHVYEKNGFKKLTEIVYMKAK